ncbi:MAG: quinate 5-dehydrogenase [Anaerolineae bacterium]|nr:quinate 5-dehydrogenase [Anaerolineae bacterium]MDW8069459.1 quinate 5-dehydrogenase [Anaerolineae bacterium]
MVQFQHYRWPRGIGKLLALYDIMKHVVSISLGSSTRDKQVMITLAGEPVLIERIGTDGDVARATQLYRELDGRVDAFGVGGFDLGLTVAGRYYPIYSVRKIVADVCRTPLVDGSGLRQTLERRVAQFIEQTLGAEVHPKRVLIPSAVDRYDLALSFAEAGYDLLFGDLGFALGLPIPLRSLRSLHMLARILLPVLLRLPFEWLYPTGEKQETIQPKFPQWYAWATVIAGDCLYIKRHMPERLDSKVIVTNTTTEGDVETFRQRGVRYLVTSTPRIEGRSFGTNVMEAALVAVANRGRPLTRPELEEMIRQLRLEPDIQRLNP